MSKHFKYASHRLYVLMAIVLQSMMKHGFIPQQFMTTMLVPILKNKNGHIASKSNYRPIALTTVASKILEIILVDHVEDYIMTTENQFAYKKGHSTDLCIFTLKECIRYHTVCNTLMYVCFLDSKQHRTILQSLQARGGLWNDTERDLVRNLYVCSCSLPHVFRIRTTSIKSV